MSYKSLSIMSRDRGLMERVTACAAVEGVKDPEVWVAMHQWQYSITPGWVEAYDYALQMGKESPGSDEAVISDQQILTAVQYIMKSEAEKEPQTGE